MRLSEHSTESARDVLVRISPLCENIMQDVSLMEQINSGITLTAGGAAGAISGLAAKVFKIIPLLLENHKNDVYGILAAVNKTTVKSIENQPFMDTLGQVKDAVNDEALVSFFSSFAPQGKPE